MYTFITSMAAIAAFIAPAFGSMKASATTQWQPGQECAGIVVGTPDEAYCATPALWFPIYPAAPVRPEQKAAVQEKRPETPCTEAELRANICDWGRYAPIQWDERRVKTPSESPKPNANDNDNK